MKRLAICLAAFLLAWPAYADSTLTALGAASALTGPEILYGVQSATDVKITATQIQTFAAAAGLTFPETVVSGVSGGIPYFSSTTVMSASALLTANALVLGGGAGAAPASLGSLGTTTTVLHGNAGGAPTFGAVSLATDVTGNLPTPVDAQTGTSYTVLSTDIGSIVTLSNAGAVAVTLPQATGSFGAGSTILFENKGVGTATITPTTSTIDGAASLALTTNQGVILISDGTNYTSMRGIGAATGGALTGTSLALTDVANPSASTLNITGATALTTSQPAINATQTWITSGTTYTGVKLNVTNTASATGSLLEDLQVGGTSQWNVDKAGNVVEVGDLTIPNAKHIFTSNGSTSGTYILAGTTTQFLNGATVAGGFNVNGMQALKLFLDPTNVDVILSRRGAANLRFGNADAAAPVAQITSVQSVITGTTNTAGVNWTLTGSVSTGSGTSGDIIFQTGGTGAGATAQNSLVTAETIKGATQEVIFAAPIRLKGYTVSALPSGNTGDYAYVTDQTATCAAAGAALTGGGAVVCPVFYNGSAWVGG